MLETYSAVPNGTKKLGHIPSVKTLGHFQPFGPFARVPNVGCILPRRWDMQPDLRAPKIAREGRPPGRPKY
jgi:hypothetical protein